MEKKYNLPEQNPESNKVEESALNYGKSMYEKKLDMSIQQAAEGRVVTVKTDKELNDLLDSL